MFDLKKIPLNYVLLAFLIFLCIGRVLDWLNPKEGLNAEDVKRIILLKESINREKEFEKKYKQLIERDEIIQKSINIDSVVIWDSERKYRDSLRSIINPR